MLAVSYESLMRTSKKTHSVVALSELSSLFVNGLYRSVMLCRRAIFLMIWCMQSECVMPELKELKQLKLSSSTKNAIVDKCMAKQKTKNTRKHSDKIKTIKSKVPGINCPYFANIFKFLLHFIYPLLLTSHWC